MIEAQTGTAIIAENTEPQLHDRRVRQEDRLEDLMLNWVRWMRTGGLSEFRIRCRSIGQGFKHYDTESSYIKLDLDNARTVDAVVTYDLKPLERDAVNAEYLEAIWPHQISVHPVLAVAREMVRIGLRRRGLWVDGA